MPKYFDAALKRPVPPQPTQAASPRPATAETGSAPAAPAAATHSGPATIGRKDTGANRTEQVLRQSSPNFKKFQQATQTRPMEATLSQVATESSITLCTAMADTSHLLAQIHALGAPASEDKPVLAQRRADLSNQLLKGVDFEFDCMDALAGALTGLQRVDVAKLTVARDVISQAGSQEAKLVPLLTRREQQSAVFQAARSKDASVAWQIIDRRTSQIVEQLLRVGILKAD
ncbi:hypothetical protein QN362_08435 [Actimicrobium sp. CCC2.4]|uniref:hypothetical protein n=1 Tax=Actimicrobium sp. CCC2.4 TaxID=3048606 RepID=UPI002AC9223D|nr:hypothetical protein [Actimicrobium sp. CCC2.4]MEB0135359.1 hypothetical protein [Actimicrobium sp. CCC2.4]WPX32465.1 hypothetical protein RHM62_01050 [Actimicrobium sp. CCC2.4]